MHLKKIREKIQDIHVCQGPEAIHIPSTIMEGEEVREGAGECGLLETDRRSESEESRQGDTTSPWAGCNPGESGVNWDPTPGDSRVNWDPNPGESGVNWDPTPGESGVSWGPPQGDSASWPHQPRRRSFEVHKYEA